MLEFLKDPTVFKRVLVLMVAAAVIIIIVFKVLT